MDFPQLNGSKVDALHVGQPVLTKQNIMDWGSVFVFPKSHKAGAFDGIYPEVQFFDMQKGTDCLVLMS